MKTVVITTTVTADVTETWTLHVPDDMQVTPVNALSLLDHPEEHGVLIYNVANDEVDNERDRWLQDITTAKEVS